MPILKYECEYCHKVLNNNPSEKARHFRTAEHQRNVRSWYESIENGRNYGNPPKPLCILYQNGYCPNGDACPFRHMKEIEVDENLVTIIPRGVIQSDVESLDLGWEEVDQQYEREQKRKEEEHQQEYKELFKSFTEEVPLSLVPPTKETIQSYRSKDWGSIKS